MKNCVSKLQYSIILSIYQQTAIHSITERNPTFCEYYTKLLLLKFWHHHHIIVDVPLLWPDFKSDTFASFAQRTYAHIIELGRGYDRIDVICDRYFASSLKTQTRDDRGSGNIMEFHDNSPFPKDFKEYFLKNSNNKDKIKFLPSR